MRQLDAPLPPLSLYGAAPSGTPVALDELVSVGPVALAFLADASDAPGRVAMLERLGAHVRLVVVSRGDHPVARALEAAGAARWLTDPKERAFDALGLLGRRLGRRRRRSGVFVVDRGRVLRLAFQATGPGNWIGAEIVRSRVERLVAAMSPLRVTPDVVVTGAEAGDEAVTLVRELGRRLGLTYGELADLETAARLRDGSEELGRSWALAPVREILGARTARVDGAGAPQGLAGDAIPLGGRILGAVDAYLELGGGPRALEVLEARAGSIYDPVVVGELRAASDEESAGREAA